MIWVSVFRFPFHVRPFSSRLSASVWLQVYEIICVYYEYVHYTIHVKGLRVKWSSSIFASTKSKAVVLLRDHSVGRSRLICTKTHAIEKDKRRLFLRKTFSFPLTIGATQYIILSLENDFRSSKSNERNKKNKKKNITVQRYRTSWRIFFFSFPSFTFWYSF